MKIPKKGFISISKAAKILQVSPDTLRNWEKEGKLIPSRTSGGARRYSSSLLYNLKKELYPQKTKRVGVLSISKAARELGISLDTLRNWDKKGLIDGSRTKGGARRFSRSEIVRLQKELGTSPTPTNFEPRNHRFLFKWFRLAIGFLVLLLLLDLGLFLSIDQQIPKNSITWESLDKVTVDLEKKISDLISSIENLQRGVNELQLNSEQKEEMISLGDVAGVSLDKTANRNIIDGRLINIEEISGDATFSNTGILSITNDAVSLGEDTSGDYVKSFTAGAGLTGDGSGEGSNPTISVGTGNGILANGDNITLDTETSGSSHTTSANSGLELQIDGLSLIRGCASGEVLKWNSELTTWVCSADSDGNGGSKNFSSLIISDEFKALGESFLGNTTIAGDLVVDGTFSISQNSLNALTTLNIQNSPLAEAVDFFNGQVTIDKKGNLISQTITVAEFKVIADKISGAGVIEVGEQSVQITNPAVKTNSRILITPTSDTNLVLAVTQKQMGESFTVSTPEATLNDISFDWWMVSEVD